MKQNTWKAFQESYTLLNPVKCKTLSLKQFFGENKDSIVGTNLYPKTDTTWHIEFATCLQV